MVMFFIRFAAGKQNEYVVLYFLNCSSSVGFSFPFVLFIFVLQFFMQILVILTQPCVWVCVRACVLYWFRALVGLVVPGADLLRSRPSSFTSVIVIVAAGLVASSSEHTHTPTHIQPYSYPSLYRHTLQRAHASTAVTQPICEYKPVGCCASKVSFLPSEPTFIKHMIVQNRNWY